MHLRAYLKIADNLNTFSLLYDLLIIVMQFIDFLIQPT